MPWSIFQEGGGKGAAVTWAQDLLSGLGVQMSPQNVQFVYDWELAEGGGGKYNPLNQGPDPSNPQLTSTGPQYGGGAADYISWGAGLQGAVDYINMPAYAGVEKGLKLGNYQQAAQALWASPWAASHYGYGANWPTEAPPGATNLAGAGPGSVQPSTTGPQTTGLTTGVLGTLGDFLGLAHFNFIDVLERLGLIILGGILIVIGIYMLAGKQVLQMTPAGRFTPQGREQERRQTREATSERRREERAVRQREAGQRQERALGLRERRVALAEKTEARHGRT
jgi:hypothetical protein